MLAALSFRHRCSWLVDLKNRLLATCLALIQHGPPVFNLECPCLADGLKLHSPQRFVVRSEVGGSCNMLIENFGERTRLRNEEKDSITQAIHILQGAA